MKQRSNKLELIDLGPEYYTPEEYQECLAYLGKINDMLGGTRGLLRAIHAVSQHPRSILDVGCGGGGVTQRIAEEWPDCQVTGIDVSSEAITYAQQHARLPNVQYICAAQPELVAPDNSYDFVVCTLVCHHLTDDQIVSFIQRALRVARHAVIINDVQRSWLAYGGFKMLAPVFFNNRLIRADGPLSIQRGFVYKELVQYMQDAGIDSDRYTIQWYPLFRWLITMYPHKIVY